MQEKVTYSSRLRLVREKLGLTQQEFGDKLGFTRAYLSMVETGKNELSRELLERLYKQYKASPNYLMHGYGPMFTDNLGYAWSVPYEGSPVQKWTPKDGDELSVKEVLVEQETPSNAHLNAHANAHLNQTYNSGESVQVAENEAISAKANLTFLPVRAQAGYLLATGGQTVMENEVERVYWPDLGRGEYFAFEVWGDSMEPSLQAGDYVIGQKIENVRALLNYEPYVLVYGDMVLVKRILKKSAAILQLISDNPAYPPEDIRWEELTQCYRVHRLLSRRIPNLSYVRTLEAKVLALESRLKGD